MSETRLTPAEVALKLPTLAREHGPKGWRLRLEISRGTIGLFAQLNFALYFIDFADGLGAVPEVRLECENYWDRAGYPDLLTQYFDVPWSSPRADLPLLVVRLRSINEIPALLAQAQKMTLPRAHEIVGSYLRLNDDVRRAESAFAEPHLPGSYLAVHFRGTDKKNEATRVPWPAIAATIRQARARVGPQLSSVFVATDEQPFVDYLAQELSDLRVVAQTDISRAAGPSPMHQGQTVRARDGESKRRLGRDALVDCLLLSKSQLLVRSASFLSGWASVFNPQLPVLMMNRPFKSYLWFPDREVIPISDRCFQEYASPSQTPAVC